MGFILIVLQAVLVFTLVRAFFALHWNNVMASQALSEIGSRGEWYTGWNAIQAIYDPRFWNMWTAKQWVQYQKSLYPEGE